MLPTFEWTFLTLQCRRWRRSFLEHIDEYLYIWKIQGITSQIEVRFEFQDICVIALCGAETWTLRKRTTLKFLKCGVREGWRRAAGTLVRKIKKYYIRVKEKRNILVQ